MVADSGNCWRSSNRARTPRRVLRNRRALPICRPSWPMKHASCVRLAISIPTAITLETSPAESKLVNPQRPRVLHCLVREAWRCDVPQPAHTWPLAEWGSSLPDEALTFKERDAAQLRWSTTLPRRSTEQRDLTLQGVRSELASAATTGGGVR